MKALGLLLAFGAFSISSLSAPATAQEVPSDKDEIVNLTTIACSDFLRTSGEDRESLLVFMHGYMSGKAGATTLDALELGEATDKIVDSCISDTSQTLMGVFETVR